ncbi:hypothetical protein LINGRAHAP2_LOCUS26162 [Linum grandiflorum]
MVYVY